MNFTWLFLSTLLYLASVEYHEVNGLDFEDLDFVRSSIEPIAENVVLNLWNSLPDNLKTAYKHVKGWIRPFVSPIWSLWSNPTNAPTGVPTTIPPLIPRNLNKFNEAIEQIERAMAHAELSREKVNMSDLRKDITDALNKGNVR